MQGTVLRHSRLIVATLVVLASFAITDAEAQSEAAGEAQAGPAVGPNTLQEIVVTAQRRSEQIQNVPITITYLSAKQLATAGTRTLADIESLTPGLRFDYAGDFAYPTIRGVGTDLADAGSGTNVGIYIDGFYSPNPTVSDFQLMNVENIQVLKGPQGTLFGSNTAGGAILVNTALPSRNANAMASVTYSSFNTQRYQSYFTTGLSHHLAFDIAGMFTQSDGWVHNIAADGRDAGAYKDYSFRTGLLYTPTDNLSFLLHYEHNGTHDPTNLTQNVVAVDGVPQTYGRFIPRSIITTDPDQVSYDDEPVDMLLHTNVFQLTSKYDFGPGVLTSYTQYRKDADEMLKSADFESIHLENLDILNAEHTFTQEFLVNSKPGGPLQWTGGVWIMNERDGWPTWGQITGSPMRFLAGSDVTVRSFAGYFNVTYQLTHDLFLTGGFRYTHDEQSDASYQTAVSRLNYPTLSSNRGTPRAVIRYMLNQYSNVYASFSTGFKAAIYNVGGGEKAPILPESLKAYEIGWKFADPTVSADLSTYYYDYNDLQVETYGLLVNDVPVSLVNNAASARIFGVDGDVKLRIMQGWQAYLGADYTHAYYTSYLDDPSNPECLSVTACGKSYGIYLTSSINGSGFEMVRAPRFTGNAGVTYTTPVAGGGDLAVSATYYYTATVYFDPADQSRQSPYSTLGVRAQWTSPSGHWSAALFGDNVTDARYLTAVTINSFGYGGTWSAPASVGVTVAYRLH